MAPKSMKNELKNDVKQIDRKNTLMQELQVILGNPGPGSGLPFRIKLLPQFPGTGGQHGPQDTPQRAQDTVAEMSPHISFTYY